MRNELNAIVFALLPFTTLAKIELTLNGTEVPQDRWAAASSGRKARWTF